MNSRLRWLLAAVAAAVAAIVLYAYFAGGASAPAGPAALAGKSAPDFVVHAVDGGNTSLAQYRGKTIVLNLWASWCPPCRAEMPDLERLYQTYHARGVVVLGIDQGESPDRARAFARSLGITYPIAVDDAQQYGRVYAALGLPTTAVIDARGVVVRGFDGPLSYPQMRSAVELALAAR